MTSERDAIRGSSQPRIPMLDIGAGDPEAPANSIPNILADLIETETWRNAATVLIGAFLIGLGYWAYHGIRESLAQTRAVSLEALLGTVVKGLDVWVGEHMTEAVRIARGCSVVVGELPGNIRADRTHIRVPARQPGAYPLVFAPRFG